MTHAVLQVAYSRTACAMIEFVIRHMSRGIARERRHLDRVRQQADESNYVTAPGIYYVYSSSDVFRAPGLRYVDKLINIP